MRVCGVGDLIAKRRNRNIQYFGGGGETSCRQSSVALVWSDMSMQLCAVHTHSQPHVKLSSFSFYHVTLRHHELTREFPVTYEESFSFFFDMEFDSSQLQLAVSYFNMLLQFLVSTQKTVGHLLQPSTRRYQGILGGDKVVIPLKPK